MTEVEYASAVWKARIIGGVMSVIVFFIGITVFGWYRNSTGLPSVELSYIISAIIASLVGYAAFLIARSSD